MLNFLNNLGVDPRCHLLAGNVNGVADGIGGRTAVAYDDNTVDAEQRCASGFFVIGIPLNGFQGRTAQPRPDAGKVAGEWLEVDLGGETTFDRTIIDQHIPGRYAGGIGAYKIQYWNGRDWKDLVIGKSMAVRQMDDFTPVTTRKVRLLISAAGENSCVYEFQVFRRKR